MGLPRLGHLHVWVGIPFYSMYLVATVGNVIILAMVREKRNLPEPMFLFLYMLLLTDLVLYISMLPWRLCLLGSEPMTSLFMLVWPRCSSSTALRPWNLPSCQWPFNIIWPSLIPYTISPFSSRLTLSKWELLWYSGKWPYFLHVPSCSGRCPIIGLKTLPTCMVNSCSGEAGTYRHRSHQALQSQHSLYHWFLWWPFHHCLLCPNSPCGLLPSIMGVKSWSLSHTWPTSGSSFSALELPLPSSSVQILSCKCLFSLPVCTSRHHLFLTSSFMVKGQRKLENIFSLVRRYAFGETVCREGTGIGESLESKQCQ